MKPKALRKRGAFFIDKNTTWVYTEVMGFINKLKNHFKEIFTDIKLQRLFVVAIGMLICNLFMWIESEYKVEPFIRICYCALFIPMALIFGRKWVPIQYVVIAFSVLYFNKWYNPLSFILVSVVAIRHRKFMIPLFVAYGFAVLVCLGIAQRSWRHGAWHIFFCLWWYYVVIDIKRELGRRVYLTVSESKIVKQMAEGKIIKEIEGYSQSTIFDKLKKARERNKVDSNERLVELYKEDMMKSE